MNRADRLSNVQNRSSLSLLQTRYSQDITICDSFSFDKLIISKRQQVHRKFSSLVGLDNQEIIPT